MVKKPRARLSDNEASALSLQLYLLGEQCPALWEELQHAGYGEPVRVVRQALRELAGSAEKYEHLKRYWVEYAKERLAVLSGIGPVDIFTGQLQAITAYRSEFLEKLREDAKSGLLKSEGAFVSRHIEPTLKRYVELLDDPIKVAVGEGIKAARQKATKALGLQELPNFSSWTPDERYDTLITRYREHLEPAGFSVEPRRKHGVAFRKLTSDARWAILFVDESRDGMMSGLESTFAIALPDATVVPRAVELRAIMAFQPDVLIYGFRAVCGFDKDSYAQLCLACDANSYLARLVCTRIDKLLSQRA